MEFMFHCDVCGKSLGTYLYGKGGVEEKAWISGIRNHYRLPDIICKKCFNKEKNEKINAKKVRE